MTLLGMYIMWIVFGIVFVFMPILCIVAGYDGIKYLIERAKK